MQFVFYGEAGEMYMVLWKCVWANAVAAPQLGLVTGGGALSSINNDCGITNVGTTYGAAQVGSIPYSVSTGTLYSTTLNTAQLATVGYGFIWMGKFISNGGLNQLWFNPQVTSGALGNQSSEISIISLGVSDNFNYTTPTVNGSTAPFTSTTWA